MCVCVSFHFYSFDAPRLLVFLLRLLFRSDHQFLQFYFQTCSPCFFLSHTFVYRYRCINDNRLKIRKILTIYIYTSRVANGDNSSSNCDDDKAYALHYIFQLLCVDDEDDNGVIISIIHLSLSVRRGILL